jgi:hypothetical protein
MTNHPGKPDDAAVSEHLRPCTLSGSTADDRKLNIPRDITLSDLWQNIPASYLLYFCGILMVCFSLGVSVDRFLLYRGIDISGIIPSGLPSLPIPTITSDARESLRKADGVSLIDALQNNVPLQRIPNGRFGYAGAYSIGWKIREGQLEAISVTTDDGYLSFEVHKANLCHLCVVVFLTNADLPAFTDPSRRRRDYYITNHRYQDFTVPVRIPLADIENWEERELPDDKGTIVEIHLRQLRSSP